MKQVLICLQREQQKHLTQVFTYVPQWDSCELAHVDTEPGPKFLEETEMSF